MSWEAVLERGRQADPLAKPGRGPQRGPTCESDDGPAVARIRVRL